MLRLESGEGRRRRLGGVSVGRRRLAAPLRPASSASSQALPGLLVKHTACLSAGVEFATKALTIEGDLVKCQVRGPVSMLWASRSAARLHGLPCATATAAAEPPCPRTLAPSPLQIWDTAGQERYRAITNA